MAISDLDSAKATLVDYFRQLYIAVGREWTQSDTDQIETAVETMYKTALNDALEAAK
jgi:hypothetical protein